MESVNTYIFLSNFFMSVTKKLNLTDPLLRAKPSKDMSHNYLISSISLCMIKKLEREKKLERDLTDPLLRVKQAKQAKGTFVPPLLTATFLLIHLLMIRKQGISGPL